MNYQAGILANVAALARDQNQIARSTDAIILNSLAGEEGGLDGVEFGLKRATSAGVEVGLIGVHSAEILGSITATMSLAIGMARIYQSIAAAKKSRAVAEWAAAAAETTVHAIAQNWTGIAFAVAASVTVATAFEAGKMAGEVSVHGVNIDTSEGQRAVQSTMGEVSS